MRQSSRYKKGETIFMRGDEGAWILLIPQGVVEVSIVSLNGRRSVLNLMEKGEVQGEITGNALPKLVYPATG